jgi:hypothetical protein
MRFAGINEEFGTSASLARALDQLAAPSERNSIIGVAVQRTLAATVRASCPARVA